MWLSPCRDDPGLHEGLSRDNSGNGLAKASGREAVLDRAAFDACMAPLEPFEDQPFLAVAVSGGADSLALALLTDDWARARGGRVVGLIVDHGLRPDSADEAAQTAAWLATRQIDHRILRWQGEKPKSGLQERARKARYALLEDWCRDHGCLHLLIAHHCRDQAETVAMRQARRSGGAGLAGMPAIRETRGLRLLRPLLGIDKGRLIATLQANGQPWIEDPSNQSPAFTRIRLRKAGLDIDALTETAKQQGRRRAEADRRVAKALVDTVTIDPAGFATLDAKPFAVLSDDLAEILLTRLLITIGGLAYPPPGRSLTRLVGAMRDDEPASGHTLGHCRIVMHRNHWLFLREHISTENCALIPYRRRRWDDRFEVRLGVEIEGIELQALGDRCRRVERLLTRTGRGRCLPALVKRTLPSLWRGGNPIAVPHLGLYRAGLTPDSLDLHFCPTTPLANAPFAPHMTR